MTVATELPVEDVIIIRRNSAIIMTTASVDVRDYDAFGTGEEGELVEVYANGEVDLRQKTAAEAMAIAVLQGDEEAAYILADEILMRFHKPKPTIKPPSRTGPDGVVFMQGPAQLQVGHFIFYQQEDPNSPLVVRCNCGTNFAAGGPGMMNVVGLAITCPGCGRSES